MARFMPTMSRYIITPLFNESSPFQPYKPGDRLTVSDLALIEVIAETPVQAAHEVFRMMNDDHRPNAATERSLSVGDVLLVEWYDPGMAYPRQERLACDPVGWKSV